MVFLECHVDEGPGLGQYIREIEFVEEEATRDPQMDAALEFLDLVPEGADRARSLRSLREAGPEAIGQCACRRLRSSGGWTCSIEHWRVCPRPELRMFYRDNASRVYSLGV
jgi:hypothetical protein